MHTIIIVIFTVYNVKIYRIQIPWDSKLINYLRDTFPIETNTSQNRQSDIRLSKNYNGLRNIHHIAIYSAILNRSILFIKNGGI